MTAKEVTQSPWLELCATYDNKERTPLPPGTTNVQGRTRRISLADVSVFTGTPPTKPLVLKIWSGDLFALNKGEELAASAIDTPRRRP